MTVFRRLVLIAVFVTVAGCASSPSQTDLSGAQAPETKPLNQIAKIPSQLVFFDSRVFDSDLSAAMRSKSPEIIVDVPSGFSLDAIPERVDRWLFAVKESGGSVVAEPVIRKRGILTDAVDLVVSFVGKIDDYFMFAPSESYEARLIYETDGSVNKIVFEKR